MTRGGYGLPRWDAAFPRCARDKAASLTKLWPSFWCAELVVGLDGGRDGHGVGVGLRYDRVHGGGPAGDRGDGGGERGARGRISAPAGGFQLEDGRQGDRARGDFVPCRVMGKDRHDGCSFLSGFCLV